MEEEPTILDIVWLCKGILRLGQMSLLFPKVQMRWTKTSRLSIKIISWQSNSLKPGKGSEELSRQEFPLWAGKELEGLELKMGKRQIQNLQGQITQRNATSGHRWNQKPRDSSNDTWGIKANGPKD